MATNMSWAKQHATTGRQKQKTTINATRKKQLRTQMFLQEMKLESIEFFGWFYDIHPDTD